jgi:hypothetical protein
MLSQKSSRGMWSPPPASRRVERARASVRDRRGPATAPRARGRTSHGRERSPECSVFASATQRSKRRLRRQLGRRGNFPPCKLLRTNETELESRLILPRSEDVDATAATVAPNRKGSRRRVHPRRRSREIGGPADSGLRNFPIRKPLKRLETAKESGWLSLLEPAFEGTPRPTPAVSSRRVGRGRYELATTDTAFVADRPQSSGTTTPVQAAANQLRPGRVG